MAYTQCFLHHHALTTAVTTRSSSQRQVLNAKPNHIVCRAQKQEDDGNLVSRRLALTVLIGVAAAASKISPADAAYGEAGILLFCSLVIFETSVVNVRVYTLPKWQMMIIAHKSQY